MNDVQFKLEKALELYGAKWWQPTDRPWRLYFNSGLMDGIKVWLQFSNSQTLAGAELKARCDIPQHPNWQRDQEVRWAEKFKASLESVEAIRDDAGLTDEPEPEPIKKKSIGIWDGVYNSLVRLNANSLAKITTEFGNVDLSAGPIGEAFSHIPFGPHVQFAGKKMMTAWLKSAGKNCRPALTGFEQVEKRGGKGGSKRWTANEPIIDGVICLAVDAAAIKKAVEPVESKATELWDTSPDAGRFALAKAEKNLSSDERANLFMAGQPGFSAMSKGESRNSSNGRTWTCVEAGKNWYVATSKR